MQATFKITVGNVPLDLTALSNMPVSDETINGDFKTVCFEETPVMSTYLVAVVVGLFDYIEEITPGGNARLPIFVRFNTFQYLQLLFISLLHLLFCAGIRVRSYCPVGKSEKGKLALNIAVKSLELYTK